MTTDQPSSYRIFLLTFWLEDESDMADAELWRFRMEDPRSRTRHGCVGLQKLIKLLRDEIAGQSTGETDLPNI